MSDTMKKVITTILLLAVFAVCVALTVIGQRNIGPAGLLMQLLGLAGMVLLLWNYNRKFK